MTMVAVPTPSADDAMSLHIRREAFKTFIQEAKCELGIPVTVGWIRSKGAHKVADLVNGPEVTIAHLNSWTVEITDLIKEAKKGRPAMGYANTEEDEDANGYKPKAAVPEVKEVKMLFTARVKMTIEVDWGHTMAQGASMLELQERAMKECAQALSNRLPGVRIIGEIEPVLILVAEKP